MCPQVVLLISGVLECDEEFIQLLEPFGDIIRAFVVKNPQVNDADT